jgi:RNAse (barnase) inhibitor barstar
MVKRIVIDGSSIRDIPSFYAEVNRVFMADENWKIGDSLDAFNDLLFGGYGALKEAEHAELVWLNMENSRQVLGYNATKNYYLEKLKPNSPFNKELFSEKLVALENGTGETYFDTILAIIAEHSNITVAAK